MSFWIDAHAHLDGREFESDRHNVIQRAEEMGILCIINAACSLSSCRESIRLAAHYPMVLVAGGIHPQEIKESLPDFSELEKYLLHPDVIAVGETGLDYYHETKYILNQKQAFQVQIELAEYHRLPLIVHSRSSDDDLIEICRQSVHKVPVIWHCFSGNEVTFQQALQMGFYFSLGGVMTFPSARRLREFIKKIPLDKLLLETDSPYLSPQKQRGKRNEPSYLVDTAMFLSELLMVPLETLQDQVFQNCCDIFGPRIKDMNR